MTEEENIQIIMVTTSDRWMDMLDKWIDEHDYLHFEDQSEAIEFIVRHYIEQNSCHKKIQDLISMVNI